MRIVGGKNRGRPLKAPAGRETRPTSDRAREGVFNILAHGGDIDFDGVTVIDLFAGSGAMGFEALSRGAASVLFVETARTARQMIQANAAALQAGGVTVEAWDATRLPARPDRLPAAGLAFLDPPYGKGLATPAVESLLAGGWLSDVALIIVEMGAGEDYSAPPGVSEIDTRRYGEAVFRFFRV